MRLCVLLALLGGRSTAAGPPRSPPSGWRAGGEDRTRSGPACCSAVTSAIPQAGTVAALGPGRRAKAADTGATEFFYDNESVTPGVIHGRGRGYDRGPPEMSRRDQFPTAWRSRRGGRTTMSTDTSTTSSLRVLRHRHQPLPDRGGGQTSWLTKRRRLRRVAVLYQLPIRLRRSRRFAWRWARPASATRSGSSRRSRAWNVRARLRQRIRASPPPHR